MQYWNTRLWEQMKWRTVPQKDFFHLEEKQIHEGALDENSDVKLGIKADGTPKVQDHRAAASWSAGYSHDELLLTLQKTPQGVLNDDQIKSQAPYPKGKWPTEAEQTFAEKSGMPNTMDTSFLEKTEQKSEEESILSSLKDCFSVRYYKEKGGRKVTEIRTPEGVIKWVFTKRLNYNAGRHLMRLARARKANDVRQFLSSVNANINQVRNDRNLDPDERRQAIAQMEGVMRRGRTKIKQLKEEDLMDSTRRQAEKKVQMKKAAKIAFALKRKKIARQAREHAQAKAAALPPQLLGAQRRMAPSEKHLYETVYNSTYTFHLDGSMGASPSHSSVTTPAISLDLSI